MESEHDFQVLTLKYFFFIIKNKMIYSNEKVSFGLVASRGSDP